MKANPSLLNDILNFSDSDLPKTDLEALFSLGPPGTRDILKQFPPEKLAQHEDLAADFGGVMPEGLRKQLDEAKRPKRLKFKAEDVGDVLDLGKEWHGVHFLLCRSGTDAPPPLGNAILGGTEIGEDRGYGPARYLEVHQAKEVADAVAQISVGEFESRYDSAALEANQIYPGHWSDPGMKGLLSGVYSNLRTFYAGAAERGFGVLMSLM